MLEGEELDCNQNYNPYCRRDIYYKTFLEIKRKAWTQLKLEHLLIFPEKLPTYLKNTSMRIHKIKMNYKKIQVVKTKWKSSKQRTKKYTIWRKNLKFKTKDKSFNFGKEICIDNLFFKFAGTSPYPKEIKFTLYNNSPSINKRYNNMKTNYNNHNYNNKFSIPNLPST
jgi:hypothetical protein